MQDLRSLEGYDDLPPDLKAMEAEFRRRDAWAERISPKTLAKLAAPLSIEAGECGTIRGVDFEKYGDPDEDAPESVWHILAFAAFEAPDCAGEPLGYTDLVKDGRRHIDIYWPKVG